MLSCDPVNDLQADEHRPVGATVVNIPCSRITANLGKSAGDHAWDPPHLLGERFEKRRTISIPRQIACERRDVVHVHAAVDAIQLPE